MAGIYLILGGNIGDRASLLELACKKIAGMVGKIEKVSSVYETEPWGFVHETPFLNQIIKARTKLKPAEALRKIIDIEKQLGREREGQQFTARTIDIDILFYNDMIIDTEDLKIPHPRLHQRRFVLEPLAEIDRGLIHPVLKKTIALLLSECTDTLKVRRLKNKMLPEY